QPPPPLGRVGAEAARALVPLDGRDGAAAQADVRGQPFDGGCELLVRLDRGGRAVPDALPFELRLDAREGERLVRPAPVGAARAGIDGGADQRVAEADAARL